MWNTTEKDEWVGSFLYIRRMWNVCPKWISEYICEMKWDNLFCVGLFNFYCLSHRISNFQTTFSLFHFTCTHMKHVSILETLKNIFESQNNAKLLTVDWSWRKAYVILISLAAGFGGSYFTSKHWIQIKSR